MKFKVGQWVYLKPWKYAGGVIDTERGVVTKVEKVQLRTMTVEEVTVFWEKVGHNDGGPWRAHWLELV